MADDTRFYHEKSGSREWTQEEGLRPENDSSYMKLTKQRSHEINGETPPTLSPCYEAKAHKSPSFMEDVSQVSSHTLGCKVSEFEVCCGVSYTIPPFYDFLAPSLGLPELQDLEVDEKVLGNLKDEATLKEILQEDARQQRLRGKRFASGESTLTNRISQLVEPRSGLFEGETYRTEEVESGHENRTWRQNSNGSMSPANEMAGDGRMSPSPSMGALKQRSRSPATVEKIPLLKIRGGQIRQVARDDTEMNWKKALRKELQLRSPAIIAREEAEKQAKAWQNLVRKDLPRWHRNFVLANRKQAIEAKRISETCQREVRSKMLRSVRIARQAPMRTKRLARDMIIFWKKVDKEQAEQKKREEKEALEARKRDEEMREARRQQQRLNFLLTQTELYSHFMQTKLAGGGGTHGAISEEDTDGQGVGVEGREEAGEEDVSEEEKEEVRKMREEAIRAAENAASVQLMKTNNFDNESSRLRVEGEGEGVPEGTDDMDLLNPSTMPATSTVSQPNMFKGLLKEYQLKGLQWLVNLYEQGLNGILADEMGLGKTIQAMSFLAHLAEEKNIWGPFLIVAPASVLSNWTDELVRFLPQFRVLPYWGGLQERTVLRKNINPKRLYKRDSAFHALVTSYQLMVSDEKYFRRVKWQYMVLDEAQAIKSANSLRWKTLLSFNCRNRLLLTGTPIQNSMAELWALLHFIMPTLFDSHDQFNEWFSKGIEGHAEHGGTLNEHQLTRLHSILKPFMLRRVKKDVEKEMSGKTELSLPCPLSTRQKVLYNAIKNKISVADLFASVAGTLNEKKVLHLMNIVIQLRKVCNHPELFERNEGKTFFNFAHVPNRLVPPAFGEIDEVYYAGYRNLIEYRVPKLVYQEGMLCLPSSAAFHPSHGWREKWVGNRLSIFAPDHLHRSLSPPSTSASSSSSLACLSLIGLSPSEIHSLAVAPLLLRWMWAAHQASLGPGEEEDELLGLLERKRMLLVPIRSRHSILRARVASGVWDGVRRAVFEPLVLDFCERMLGSVGLLRAVRGYTPAVVAPQLDVWCSDRSFAYRHVDRAHDPLTKLLLVGWARASEAGGPHAPPAEPPLIQEMERREALPALLAVPYRIFGCGPYTQTMDFAKMLTDSGKLQTLDRLLRSLKPDGHRVLVFAQMTKMLNILEDYMNYRKYKYLRLDGSSTITDRRDMVKDFQSRPDIFVFLLSTRAGGLGINLTAADTVVFYESDWNPTMDLQAMDRAHRLGQTRHVTVYRLICEGTVEEKIVKRANQKNTVQQLVMTGGKGGQPGDVFNAEEVVSLLLDDAELERQMKEQAQVKPERVRKKKGGGLAPSSIRLDAEGSAFLDDESGPDKPSTPSDQGQLETASKDSGSEKQVEGNPDTVGKRGAKRKQTGEEKPQKPPKAPKTPKTPKPRKNAAPKVGEPNQRRLKAENMQQDASLASVDVSVDGLLTPTVSTNRQEIVSRSSGAQEPILDMYADNGTSEIWASDRNMTGNGIGPDFGSDNVHGESKVLNVHSTVESLHGLQPNKLESKKEFASRTAGNGAAKPRSRLTKKAKLIEDPNP